MGGLVLLLAGCTLVSSETTVPKTEPPITVTSTLSENGRSLEIVGCDSSPTETKILCEAYDLIHTRYVDPVSDATLSEGAAEGLALLDGADQKTPLVCVAPSREFVDACSTAPEKADDTAEAAEAMVFGMVNLGLDPYSAYLDADLLALIKEEQDGRVEGIGALVIAENRSASPAVRCNLLSETCHLFIVSTIPGSPAEVSGIKGDDIVVAVGGIDVSGMTIDEVTGSVRGAAGTEVQLTVLRDGITIEFTIVRAAVDLPVVESEVFDGAGYIRLNQFTENAGDQLEKAIFDLLTDGMNTLVLDLRDNPGGLLSTAIDVASDFLPDGDVVITRSPESNQTYAVSGNEIVPESVKVILVMNRGSASASELVAALLQERGRATIVGENSFGKNTVQQQFNLSNGGALKLTIARWVTPGGLDFGGVGVTPDVLRDFPSDMSTPAVVDLALTLG